MKKILLYPLSLFILSSLFITLQAQESKPVPNDNPALKEAAMKAKAQKIQNQKNKPAPAQLAAPAKQKGPIDENDMYMGRKSEFLNNMTVTDLPADFPKYDKSYGLKNYNMIVDDYYAAHLSILKENVRKKLEQSHPFTPQQTK